MRHVWSAALLLATTSAAGSLHAQAIPSPFEYIERKNSIGLFGGYVATDAGSQDLGPGAAPLFGIRYDYQVTGPLSLEASAAFARSDRTIYARSVATQPALEPVGEADVGLVIADAGLRFHLTGPRTWNGLAPFIAVTAGVVADINGPAPEEDDLEDNQAFEFGPGLAASAGLGIDYFLTDRVSLRADVRDRLWRYTYPVSLSPTGVEDSEWVHNPGFSIGAALHF